MDLLIKHIAADAGMSTLIGVAIFLMVWVLTDDPVAALASGVACTVFCFTIFVKLTTLVHKR